MMLIIWTYVHAIHIIMEETYVSGKAAVDFNKFFRKLIPKNLG